MFVIGNFKHNFIELPDQEITRIDRDNYRAYSTPDGLFPSVTSVVGWEKNKTKYNWK